MSLAKLKRDIETLKRALDVTDEDDPIEIDFERLPEEHKKTLTDAAHIYFDHRNKILEEKGYTAFDKSRSLINVPFNVFTEAEKKVMLKMEEIYAEYGEPHSVIDARQRREHRGRYARIH